jgi:hypothetical protein
VKWAVQPRTRSGAPSRLLAAGPAGLLSIAVLVAACSTGPVSQATSLATAPASAPAGASEPAASGPSVEPDATPTEPPATPTPPPPTDVPPKPGDPTFTLVSQVPSTTGTVTETYRITWTEPDGVATRFLVYGVTECLRYAEANDGTPCVVKGMKIPRTSLVLIGQAPGDARELEVTWETGVVGPGPYWSILMRATNDLGDSIFTIVHTQDVCFGCTY